MIRSQDGGRGAAALPPERPSHAPSEPPACAESLAREGTPSQPRARAQMRRRLTPAGPAPFRPEASPAGLGEARGPWLGRAGTATAAGLPGLRGPGGCWTSCPQLPAVSRTATGWFTVPMAAVITAIAWGPGHATVPSGPGRALSQGPSPRGHRPAGGGLGRRSWMPAHSGLRPGPARPHGGRDAAGAPACSCLETPGRQLRLSS